MNHNLAVPADVKLHIIYAQRGDAFVLEYEINNVRRLLLVDGGPTAAMHSGSSLGAPYYRHWVSAVRSVWGKNNTADLDLDIVVTHADEDHYGGILAFLEAQTTWPRDPINWNTVNILTPYLNASGYDQVITAARNQNINLEAERLDQNLLQGFTMLAPDTANIIRARRAGTGILNANAYMTLVTYDGATETNSSSLIFQNNTDANAATLEGAILFTGDNSACNILPAVGNAVPHLAVYKISHHGAFKDSVADYDVRLGVRIAENTTTACRVLMLLDWALDGSAPLTMETYTPQNVGLAKRYAEATLAQCLNLLNTQNLQDARVYRDQLRQQYNSFVTIAFTFRPSNAPDPATGMTIPDPPGLVQLNPTPLAIDNAADPRNFLGADGYYRGVPGPKTMRAWFSHLCLQSPVKQLLDVFEVGQCAQFYSKFKADAYVVSGSFQGNYKHPRPQVLCGLALACQGHAGPNGVGHHKASLYLTDARTFWQPELETFWVPLLNTINSARYPGNQAYTGDANFYFTQDILKVYVLANRLYMTIDASKDSPDGMTPWDRLIGNRGAEPLEFSNEAKETAQTYRKALEGTFNLLSAFSVTMRAKRYCIRAYRCTQQQGQGKVGLTFSRIGLLSGSPLQVIRTPTGPNVQLPLFHVWEIAYNRNGEDFSRIALNDAADPDGDPQFVFARMFGFFQNSSFELIAPGMPEEMFVFNDLIQNNVTRQAYNTTWYNNYYRDVCAFRFEEVPYAAPAPVGLAAAAFEEVREEEEMAIEVDGLAAAEDIDEVDISAKRRQNIVRQAAPEDLSQTATAAEVTNISTEVFSFLRSDDDQDIVIGGVENETDGSLMNTDSTKAAVSVVPMKVREYLEYRYFEPDTITTRGKALDAILGRGVGITSSLKMGYDTLLMASLIDLDSSGVELDSNAGNEILSITLQAREEPKEIAFGQDNLQVVSSSVILMRKNKEKVDLKLSISTQSGVTVEASKLVTLVAQKPKLRQFLGDKGFAADALKTLRLEDILQLIIGTDEPTQVPMFTQAWVSIPSVFHTSGIFRLVPNLDDSTVETFSTPAMLGTMVKDATINAHLDSAIFPSSLDIAGMKIEVDQVAFQFRDLHYQRQTMLFTGSVKIVSGDSQSGLRLSMTCVLGPELPEMVFEAATLSSLTSLDQLEASVSAFKLKSVEDLGVPLLKPSEPSTGDVVRLKALPSGSSVGFSLRERKMSEGKYELASVFLSIDSNDWKNYLPESLKTPDGVSIKTKITVFCPASDSPAIRVQIDFQLPVDEKRHLSFSFAAVPLSFPGDYDYHMAIDCVGGLTLKDITDAMGFSVLDVSLISDIPLLAKLISTVGVQHFDASVNKTARSLTDWSIDLVLREPLELIGGRFALNDAKVNISRVGESLRSSGSATLYIVKLDKYIDATYRTPQFGSPGFVRATVVQGIKVNDVLSALGVEGLDQLPVIGTLLKANIRFLEACFGYKLVEKADIAASKSDRAVTAAANYEDSLSIFGAGVEFFWNDRIVLGPLVLEQTTISTYFHSKYHPSNLADAEEKGFKITANIFDNSTRAEVIYNAKGASSLITASLRPFTPITINQMLKSMLPSALQADLSLAVRDITMNQSSLGIYIDTSKEGRNSFGLDRFDIKLGRATALDMNGSPAQAEGFKLVDLMVAYRRGKAVDPSVPAPTLPDRKSLIPTEHDKKKAKRDEFSHLIKSIAAATQTGAIMGWNNDERYPEANTLVVTATAGLNGKRARLAFGYQGKVEGGEKAEKAASTVALSVTGIDPGALRLDNILSLFGFAVKPSYDNPDDSVSFWNFEILRLGGSVKVLAPPAAGGDGRQDQSAPESTTAKFVLSTAEMAVESGDHPLELLSQPKIIMDKVGLDVTYDAERAVDSNSGLEATFYAILTVAGHPLRIICRKDAKYGFVFLGYMRFSRESNVALKTLTSQFLDTSAKFDVSSDLRLPAINLGHVSFVFQQHRLVQISALGYDLWSYAIAGTGLKFNVDKLGAFLKAEKIPADEKSNRNDGNQEKKPEAPTTGGNSSPREQGKYEYTVQVAGQFSIEGYDGFTVATALVNITPSDDKILTVTLMTNPEIKADIASLASRLTLDDSSNWTQLSSSTQELVCDAAAKLYINFTQSRFIITTIIKDIGGALLMGKKLTLEGKRGWFFVASLTSLERIFPTMQDLKEAVSSSFTISKLSVQILSYDTTPKGLAEDLATAITGSKAKNEKLDSLKIKENTPGELKLDHSDSTVVPATRDKPSDAIEKIDSLDWAGIIPNVAHVTAKDEKIPDIKAGTWFFAEIGLGMDADMSSALTLAADPGASDSAKIILYAHVSSGADTTYYIDVRKLRLVGGALEMNGSGVYTYNSTTKTKVIDIRGTLSLELRQRIDFKVEYHCEKDITSFKVAADWTSTATIDRPFEDMYNVRLIGLGIKGTIKQDKNVKSTEYEVFGVAQIGPGQSNDSLLQGTIGFKNNKPVAGFITYTADAQSVSNDCMSIGDVSSKLLAEPSSEGKVAKSPQYPQEFPDFSFTSATIGYVMSDIGSYQHANRIYDPGFTLQANIYLFDVPFFVRLNLRDAKNGGGVKFTVMYEKSIELDFADIVGHTEDEGGSKRALGPAIEFDAQPQSKKLQVKAGISFFKTSAIDFSFAYDFKNALFSGTFDFGNFLGVRNSKVGFTYKDGRFTFQGFKLIDGLDGTKGMQKALDVRNLLKEGGKGKDGTCGALIDFVFDKILVTKFIFKLSLPEDGGGGGGGEGGSPSNANSPRSKGAIAGKYKSVVGTNGQINLQIDWGYQIGVQVPTGEEFDIGYTPIVTLEKLGSVPISISPKLNKDGLLATLGDIMINNVPKIAEKLANDKAQLTALAAIILYETLGREAAKAWICRGAEREELAKKAESTAESEGGEGSSAAEAAAAAAAMAAAAVAAAGEGAAAIILGFLLGGLAALALAYAIYKALEWLEGKLNEWKQADAKKALGAIEAAKKKIALAASAALASLSLQLQGLRDVLKFAPNAEPTVTWYSSDPTNVYVECMWDHILPKAVCDKDGKPLPGACWKVMWSTNADFKEAVTDTTNIPSFQIRSDNLAYERTVYVKVKSMVPIKYELMQLPDGRKVPDDWRIKKLYASELETRKKQMFGGEEFIEASDYSSVASDSQVPFLRPPTRVLYRPSQKRGVTPAVEDPAEGEVTVSGVYGPLSVRVSDHWKNNLALWDEDYVAPELTGAPSSASITAASPLQAVPIRVRLIAPPGYPGLDVIKETKAFVRHVSKSSDYRNSMWIESTSAPMVDRVKVLHATMQDMQIRATWAAAISSPEPLLYLIQGKEWLGFKAQKVETTSEGTRSALLTAPDGVQHGMNVRIAVCDTKIPAGSIAVYEVTTLVLDYLPNIVIDGANSYLDINTNDLYLSIKTSFEKRARTAILAQFQPTSRFKTLQTKTGDYSPSTAGQNALLVIKDIRAPISASIRIVVSDEESGRDKTSDGWKLSVAQSSLPRPNISARIGNNGKLVVSWVEMATIKSIVLDVKGGSKNPVLVDQTKYYYQFEDENLPHPPDRGAKYTISAYSVKSSVRGAWSTLEFVVPDQEVADIHWTGPFEAQMETVSADASLRIFQHSADLSAYSLWATSQGKIIYEHTEKNVPWQVQGSDTIPDGSKVTAALASGSSFACAYLSELHQEVYWIGGDGSIQGRRRHVDPKDVPNTAGVWSIIDDFPFTAAGTASTVQGGSISAAAASDGSKIDLWWVAEDRSLVKASFATDPGEWTDASVVVYGEMGPSNDIARAGGTDRLAPPPPPSRLAASIMEDLYTDLVWITSSGRVQGERTFHGNLHGYIYGFHDEGVDAVNAAPTSSLCSLARRGVSNRIWWISPNGSILTAVQLHDSPPTTTTTSPVETKNKDKEKPWHISIVSGYQSASLYSEIAAVYLNDEDLRIFWVSPNNQLVSAKAGSTKAAKTSWQVSSQLPTVKICNAGGDGQKEGNTRYLFQRVVAAPLGEKKIGVWYINVDGKVNNLVWDVAVVSRAVQLVDSRSKSLADSMNFSQAQRKRQSRYAI